MTCQKLLSFSLSLMRLLIQHLCVLGREALKLPWYADAGIVSSSRSRPRELL